MPSQQFGRCVLVIDLSPHIVRQFLKFDKDGMAPTLKKSTPFVEGASKGGNPLTLPDGAILESGESCIFSYLKKRDRVKGVFERAENNKHGRIRYKDQAYSISYYAIRDLKEVDNNDKEYKTDRSL